MKLLNSSFTSYRSIPFILGGLWLVMLGSLFVAHARVNQQAKFGPAPVKSWTWDNQGLNAIAETSKLSQKTEVEGRVSMLETPTEDSLNNK